MTEKKMTLTQQRDEWRNLALQERERANEAEGMRDTYKADLYRAEAELSGMRSWAARWERWRNDGVFVTVLLLVGFVFLFLVTH